MDKTTAQKRKRLADKFYAVRIGHRPGIYNSYPECFSQVKGYKGATFKSFINLSDAERFLKGEDVHDPSQRKFYAVRVGKVPGIYTSWTTAEQQIKGWSKPKYKCFASRAEAQSFLDGVDHPQRGGDIPIVPEDLISHPSSNPAKRLRTDDAGSSEQIKAATGSRGATGSEMYELANSNMIDGFDSSIVLDDQTGYVRPKSTLQSRATKLMSAQPRHDRLITVYTDGSSLNNGRKGAYAGVGVFFGPGEKNISEPLHGPRQTNQRAELTAILRALEHLPNHLNVEIVTDSQYSIKSLTQWSLKWQEKGWQTATGKQVDNRDLMESILARMALRKSFGAVTHFRWTKGHAGDPGNVEADKLAVAGARLGALQSTGLNSKSDN